MSQRLTYEVAQTLKKGDILYNNVLEFTDADGDRSPATAVVMGKPKKHPVEEFLLPIKRQYGDGGMGNVSKFGSDLWRTTPEKVVAKHIVRTRPAPVEEEEVVTPTHVRRTRR